MNMQGVSPWNDERVERLRKLVDEGLSGLQIANELGGVSRNSVIGKCYRLGLVLQGQGGREAQLAAMRARGEPWAPKFRTRGARQWRRKDALEPSDPPALEPSDPPALERRPLAPISIPYLERRIGHECATILNYGRPVDELLVCGREPIVGGFEMCEQCAGRFLTKQEPRRRRKPPVAFLTSSSGAWL